MFTSDYEGFFPPVIKYLIAVTEVSWLLHTLCGFSNGYQTKLLSCQKGVALISLRSCILNINTQLYQGREWGHFRVLTGLDWTGLELELELQLEVEGEAKGGTTNSSQGISWANKQISCSASSVINEFMQMPQQQMIDINYVKWTTTTTTAAALAKSTKR